MFNNTFITYIIVNTFKKTNVMYIIEIILQIYIKLHLHLGQNNDHFEVSL